MSDSFKVTNRDGLGNGQPASEPLAMSAPVAASAPAAQGAGAATASAAVPASEPQDLTPAQDPGVDLVKRRDELTARFAELQCDLGGLVYEMAIRDHIRVDVLVRRAAILQDVDAELGEVERILRTEETGAAGSCSSCGAPHSSGAVYCWQCGQPLLEHVSSQAIGAASPSGRSSEAPGHVVAGSTIGRPREHRLRVAILDEHARTPTAARCRG